MKIIRAYVMTKILANPKNIIVVVVLNISASCSTYNVEALVIRKRSRVHNEAIVTDMRNLKTPYEKRRQDSKSGDTKLEVFKRKAPAAGLSPSH